jgi:hypothetical protein
LYLSEEFIGHFFDCPCFYKLLSLLEVARNLEYLPENKFKEIFEISREIELKFTILIRK